MNSTMFIGQVSERLGCDRNRAEGLAFVVFQELRDRLTAKESMDVEAQLPIELKRLWRAADRANRPVAKMHESEFLSRVRHFAGLPDEREAERAVRAVFAALQQLLGSPTGMEGEAWDVFSVLPKDLKMLWVGASEHAPR